MVSNLRRPNPSDLLASLLDTSYAQTTGGVIAAIATDTERGALAERLKEFERRAKELADENEALSEDDAVLRALLADTGDALKKDATLIDAVSAGLELTGIAAAYQFVRQTTLPGIDDGELFRIGVTWNSPDPEAINAVVNYTMSDEWKALLASYGDIENRVAALAYQGIAAGRGALAIAQDVRDMLENMPADTANAIMRTLQMASFRQAAAVNQVANSDILEAEQIRIAALDDRTCMSCVSLHGTTLPLGATVDDHWNGRCTSVTVIKGFDYPSVQTGEDWFNNRTEAQQVAQMGQAAYDAWKAGAIDLSDFPQHVIDDVFGDMIVEASLKGMLGDEAKNYYTNAG